MFAVHQKNFSVMKKRLIIVGISAFLLGAVVYSAASYYTTKVMGVKRPRLETVLPGGYDSVSISELYNMGFEKSKVVRLSEVIQKRKMYQDKYGLLFMSDSEMKSLLGSNNFIMGATNKFIGDIPAASLKEIVENVGRLNDARSVFNLTLTHDDITFELYSDELNLIPSNGHLDWQSYQWKYNIPDVVKASAIKSHGIPASDFWTLDRSAERNQRVMIIAGANQFDISGMQVVEGILSLPVPKDPIAVLKVPGGYVELANWE